jgi:urease accessory protein
VDLRCRGDQGLDRGLSARSPDVVARLEFRRRGALTDLACLFQQGSLRVLRPNVPAGEPACAVLLNTSGGIVGGDVRGIEARLAPGAAAMITTQAAEKVYRSAGGSRPWTSGWCSPKTPGSSGCRRRPSCSIAPGSAAAFRSSWPHAPRLLAADLLVFGRRAGGERFRRGLLHDLWEVRSAGRLVWADALRLADDPGALLEAPFGFARAGAAATAIYVGPDAAERLELARSLIDHPEVRSGATCMAPVLILRWLGEDPARVRWALQQFSTRFRHAVAGLPERVPAIWRS